MSNDIVLLALFSTAMIVALVSRWLKVPYTVALVVAGLALGTKRIYEPPHLTKELLYAVFLPGLLFEAAFHLKFREFWRNKLAINALAVPGVAVSILLTAGLLIPVTTGLHLAVGFRFQHAMIFAAMVAATDPIAVVALFRKLGAPKRLAVLIEGESLLNDGTAVVMFTIIFTAASGTHLSIGLALFDFVRVVAAAIAIGAAIAFAASKLTAQIEDPMIEISISTLVAYGSFVAAEHLHFSGVIATVTAGIVFGSYGATAAMTASTRIAVESFWEYVAFALNSVVFLLIGFEVRVSALLSSWYLILVAYAAMTVARVVVIALVTLALRRSTESIPRSWGVVLSWGGLRGALSMVLALGLPASFAHRELLVTMTFGVVIISILVQGLSMGPLIRRLGLAGVGTDVTAHDIERANLMAAQAALSALKDMSQQHDVAPEVAAHLAGDYARRVEDAEQRIRELHLRSVQLGEDERRAAERQLLYIEKDAVIQAQRKGVLSAEAAEHVVAEIDGRLVDVESRESKTDLAHPERAETKELK